MIEHEFKGERGPLSFLLDLVKKNNSVISDISLARLADEYVEFISQKAPVTIEESMRWCHVATQLLLLKARYIVGSITSATENDNGSSLTKSLLVLKAMKQCEVLFDKQWSDSEMLFSSSVAYFPPQPWSPPPDFLSLLHTSMVSIIFRLQSEKKMPSALLERTISLNDVIDELEKALVSSSSFFSLWKIRPPQSRADVVVSFLAILELMRRGKIVVREESGQFMICIR